MIIFDLDGTLADCEHRRHFVDPKKNENFFRYNGLDFRGYRDGKPQLDIKFEPDWQAFYEACDLDKPILPTIQIINNLILLDNEVQIWSGRCESVREKTENWLYDYLLENGEYPLVLKMRPIGDFTPDDELKERWLDKYFESGRKNCSLRWATHEKCCKKIDFVFDSDPDSIRMWRCRGVFVFNCSQNEDEF